MNRRTVVFLVLLAGFTSVYSSASFYLLSPQAAQPFMGFGVFSDNGTLSNYIPGSGLVVPTNQTVHWHLQVTNRMGAVQFVRIVVRLGNLTSETPSQYLPAEPLPTVAKLERFVSDQHTESVRFDWQILSTNRTAGKTFPGIQINSEKPFLSSVGTQNGRDYRFIFELWTFEISTGSFLYGWRSGGQTYGTWLQVWFDVS